MELTDGVLVDAVITPYSRYQNGLNAYCVSMMYREEDLVSGEDFIFSPVIYGYSPEELAQLLAEQSGFSPEYVWKTISYPDELIGNLTMRDQAGVERTLWCGWRTDGKVQAEKILKSLTDEDYYTEVICVSMGEANRQLLKDRGYEGNGNLINGDLLYLEQEDSLSAM